jgi:anaerobic ribonucleoside-triphosphate reductase activating protein
MNVERILYPVKVPGPGNRAGIWVRGCPRRCPGCGSPELWERHQRYEMALTELEALIAKIAAKCGVDGFTITGGEPMEQAEELSALVSYLQTISTDTYEELRKAESDHIKVVLGSIAVLIDGEYLEGRNNGLPLRGSDNQRIIVLNPAY